MTLSDDPSGWRVCYALVACLTPSEACEAFDVECQQPHVLRRALVGRIVGDLRAEPKVMSLGTR